MPFVEVGLDFESAEKISGPIPEGDYDVQVTSVTLGETGPNSKVPGSPMLKWEFEVINSSNVNLNGRKLFLNMPIPRGDGKGLNFLVATCKALGRPWSGQGLNTDDYLGRTCKAKVTIEEYNGAFNNKVGKVY